MCVTAGGGTCGRATGIGVGVGGGLTTWGGGMRICGVTTCCGGAWTAGAGGGVWIAPGAGARTCGIAAGGVGRNVADGCTAPGEGVCICGAPTVGGGLYARCGGAPTDGVAWNGDAMGVPG